MDDHALQVWAVDALGAPAHETRLAVADHLAVPPSTMSHHLATLERAGLVQSERESRLIHYRTDYQGMRRLLILLTQDCCGGAPEMCSDLTVGLNCEPVNRG